MSKLEELIQELCPDGVEYISLDQCTEKVDNIKWKNAIGTYQYIDLTSVDRDTHRITETQAINASNAPSRAQQIVKTGDILLGATRPMLKRYCMIDMQFDGQICSTGFCVLRPNKELVLNRWVYHNISSTKFFDHVEKFQKGASYPAISDVDVRIYKIPVPPLEVQREIVRILDNFTELTAELTAELAARRKQYGYYRDYMLSFKAEADVHIVSLAECCESIADGDHQPPPKSDSGIPFITISNITGEKHIDFTDTMFVPQEYYDRLDPKRRPQKDDILYTVVGSFGTPVHLTDDIKFVFQRHIAILRPKKSTVMPRYLYHAMQTSPFYKQADINARGAAQRTISLSSLNSMKIPVPSMDVQKRLVHVLDNFDAICTDLNIGLPAEIEARQKQYEFYRDKLLTFAATGEIISEQASKQASKQASGV